MNISNKIIWGIFLILLGIIGIINKLHIFGDYFELIIIALGFLFVYILRGGHKKYRNIGFLIPGCIIPAVIIMDIVDKTKMLSTYKDPLIMVIIGTAFLLIYLIHTVWVTDIRKGSKNWPLVVALIIYAISIFVFITEISDSAIGRLILNNLWPVILILAGIVILIKSFYSGGRSHK